MKKRVFRIIDAYLTNYWDSFSQEMYPDGQISYYPEQEQSYTDLEQLDSQHGEFSFKERYPFVYNDAWENPSWADGNFSAPYHNEIFEYNKLSPNDNSTLFHPDNLRGGSMNIEDLGSRQGNSVDKFLVTKDMIKVSSMDLTEFMKVSDDTLVHKSKKDLWKIFQGANGETYIKRLFEEDIIKDN